MGSIYNREQIINDSLSGIVACKDIVIDNVVYKIEIGYELNDVVSDILFYGRIYYGTQYWKFEYDAYTGKDRILVTSLYNFITTVYYNMLHLRSYKRSALKELMRTMIVELDKYVNRLLKETQ